jgi:hypothetical protein
MFICFAGWVWAESKHEPPLPPPQSLVWGGLQFAFVNSFFYKFLVDLKLGTLFHTLMKNKGSRCFNNNNNNLLQRERGKDEQDKTQGLWFP